MESSEMLKAQDQYEEMIGDKDYLPLPPKSLSEHFLSCTEQEAWSVLSEAVGDLPIPYGDLGRALHQLADEYENWNAPSALFKEKSAAFVWMVMEKMQEITEEERS